MNQFNNPVPKLVLAVLQNMWGWRGYRPEQAPLHFKINPENHSGRRLYQLVDEATLRVTNSSSICVEYAHQSAPIDLPFLTRAALDRPWDLVLVCGRQANEAWRMLEPKLVSHLRTLELPHPAWRSWDRRLIEETRLIIAEELDA